MPAPAVLSPSARSCSRTCQPRRASAHAAARPANPPPTISARRCATLLLEHAGAAQQLGVRLVLAQEIRLQPVARAVVDVDAAVRHVGGELRILDRRLGGVCLLY